MKKILYEYLVNDCIEVLLRKDWDSGINRVHVVMNLVMINIFVKPVQIVDYIYDHHIMAELISILNNEE